MSDRIGTVEFDVDERTYRAEYDPEAMAPSVAVVDAVRSVFADERVHDLPQLYDVVDPDALDSLLEPRPNRDRHGPRSVTFPYGDAKVTVTSDGRSAIRPIDETDR